jgi:hypothetical protein
MLDSAQGKKRAGLASFESACLLKKEFCDRFQKLVESIAKAVEDSEVRHKRRYQHRGGEPAEKHDQADRGTGLSHNRSSSAINPVSRCVGCDT